MKEDPLTATVLPGYQALRAGRSSVENAAYHLRTSVADQRQLLAGAAAELAAKTLLQWQFHCRFLLLAFVVMPEHVHVLGVLLDNAPIGRAFGRWKAWSSGQLRQLLGLEGEERFWQAGFFDRRIRRNEDLTTMGRYAENNPVRRGLVETAEQFPYSSADPLMAQWMAGRRWLSGKELAWEELAGKARAL